MICGLIHTVVDVLPNRTRPRTRPAACGVKLTCNNCFCGVDGGLFQVTDDDGNGATGVNVEARDSVKLAMDDPLVPMYSSCSLMSLLLSTLDDMICMIAVFGEPIAVFSTSSQKLSSGDAAIFDPALDTSLRL